MVTAGALSRKDFSIVNMFLPAFLSNAPLNKVTIVSKRHSGNLLARIQKNSQDTGLRQYDELAVDSYLC
jgi:hypothetical protein